MPLASTDSAMIVTRSWSTDMKPPSTCAVRHEPSRLDPHLALTEHAQDRLVTGQDAEVARRWSGR